MVQDVLKEVNLVKYLWFLVLFWTPSFSFEAIASPAAEEDHPNYPWLLKNSYVSFSTGYIGYDFSSVQLEPGHNPADAKTPWTAARLSFGRNFNQYFSAQVEYIRPVKWVRYSALDNSYSGRLLTNMAGLTWRSTLPLPSKFSIFFEGGLGIITRSGFSSNGLEVVKDANYTSLLWGGGAKYKINRKWDIETGFFYSPSNKKFVQPPTVVAAIGAVLNFRPALQQNNSSSKDTTLFPKNIFQIGITTNEFGTKINSLVSGGIGIPFFWGGNVGVASGQILHFERNILHTKKIFSLDWGISLAKYQSATQKKEFITISAFPLFRLTPFRTKVADFYFDYSLAGPTYISKIELDAYRTGKHFTFQDMMGVGLFMGPAKRINLETSIGHYSNGNLFPKNVGLKIPLTFSVGFTF